MDETKELLKKEIDTQIMNLAVMDAGSENKARAVEDVSKLYKLKLEEEKLELDAADKKAERRNTLIDQVIGHVIVIGTTVFTVRLSKSWLKDVLDFEKTGAITSDAFKILKSGFRMFK